jgi:hypothetical protein
MLAGQTKFDGKDKVSDFFIFGGPIEIIIKPG